MNEVVEEKDAKIADLTARLERLEVMIENWLGATKENK